MSLISILKACFLVHACHVSIFKACFLVHACHVSIFMAYFLVYTCHVSIFKACFDVRESSTFWSLMSLLTEVPGSDQPPPEWLSTHPTHENRASKLDDMIPAVCNMFLCSNPSDYYKVTVYEILLCFILILSCRTTRNT